MKATDFKGAMTALITPFDADNRVDVAALTKLVEAQIAGGINGLVACGTTAETPTMSSDEQELVIKTVVEVTNGRVPVIAGTGSNNTAATAAYTKKVMGWGVDAALVVCPYYNKPKQDGLFAHFKAVYEETGAPIIAYNVPGRTASDLLPETIGALVDAGAIAGTKDATANMIRTVDTLAAVGDRPFAMLSGDDFTILPFVACGGRGVISVVSNVAPGATAQLVKEAAAANYETARPLNTRIVQLTRALFVTSNPVPVKAAMSMAGWCRPDARLPLVTADESVRETVRAALATFAGSPNFEGQLW